MNRLNKILEFPDFDNFDENYSRIEFICKWGCDGSSGYNEFMQTPKDNTNLSDVETQNNIDMCSDSNLFLFSLVPLQLIMTNKNNDNKIVIWQNITPSSNRFCRPIKCMYLKETIELINQEVNEIEKEILNLQTLIISINENPYTIHYKLLFTMVDGKVINAIINTSSQCCFICGCKPTNMNDLTKIDSFEINEDNMKYGLSVLHMWFKCLEFILKIAYKLEIKSPTIRGASEEQKKRIEEIKKEIQLQLWKKNGYQSR